TDFFRLEGYISRKGKKEKIVAKVQPGQKKVFECNDVPYGKIAEHIGHLPVVMITPDDTQLATEGSEERRRFLDNTLSQINPQYLKNLMHYNKVLKQRNAALKQMAAAKYFDDALVNSYDAQLLRPAPMLYEARRDFLERFAPIFGQYYQKISGGAEQVAFHYRSQLSKQSFEELLREAREKDRILQRTTVGLHKDDLTFSVNGHPLKRFGSQGQLKSFVLALKLAQYELLRREKEIPPLLLLDDIFDKLDLQRIRFLLELLFENDFGQIFLTDTQKDRVQQIVDNLNVEYRIFEIEQGKANPTNQLTN
ncbi:MAG: DNA replication and repair protein RecF, partial [Bacteroidota bacterium]